MFDVNLADVVETGMIHATCKPEPDRFVFLRQYIAELVEAKQSLVEKASKYDAMEPEHAPESVAPGFTEAARLAFTEMRDEVSAVNGEPVCDLFIVLIGIKHTGLDISSFLKLSS